MEIDFYGNNNNNNNVRVHVDVSTISSHLWFNSITINCVRGLFRGRKDLWRFASLSVLWHIIMFTQNKLSLFITYSVLFFSSVLSKTKKKRTTRVRLCNNWDCKVQLKWLWTWKAFDLNKKSLDSVLLSHGITKIVQSFSKHISSKLFNLEIVFSLSS